MPSTAANDNDHLHQAAGMVSVQAHCTVNEALLLIKKRAHELRERAEMVALDVLDGEIRFDD